MENNDSPTDNVERMIAELGIPIEFRPVGARLKIQHAANERTIRSISMQLEFARRQDVRLHDEHPLRHASWHLYIEEELSDSTKRDMIGALLYSGDHKNKGIRSDDPEDFCNITTKLDTRTFDSLLEAIHAGRFFDYVLVT